MGSCLKGFLTGTGSTVGLYLLVIILNTLMPPELFSLVVLVILSIIFWAITGSYLEGLLAGTGSAVGLYLLIRILISSQLFSPQLFSLVALVILSIIFWAVFANEEKVESEQADAWRKRLKKMRKISRDSSDK